MRKELATILAAGLTIAQVSAYAADNRVSLTDAIAREAARLAREPESTPAKDHWSAVRRLTAGTPIVVTTSTGRVTRLFVAADDQELILLNASHPLLPPFASERLIDLASNHPEAVVDVLRHDMTLIDRQIRLERAGIFVDDRQVVDFDQIVQSIAANDITQVRRAPHFRSSIAGAIAGAAGGFLLSIPIGVSLAFKQCGGSCSDELLLMNLSFVGLPIAGGIVGARAFGSLRSEIIYETHAP
jgi:hypothetical protein